MKVIAIIPSRYESTRFSGKPLASINGKSMVQRVYERVSKSDIVNNVYIATDDERIYNSVAHFGGSAIMTSKYHVSGTDRVAEAASILNLNMTDLIINIQGDQPFINPKCFDSLIFPFYKSNKFEMSTLAFPTKNSIEINDTKCVSVVFDIEGNALYFSRSVIPYNRDSKDINIYKHLGIYAYKRSFLEIFKTLPEGILEKKEKLEQLRVLEHGYRVLVIISSYDSPEIDTLEDIKQIENKINK